MIPIMSNKLSKKNVYFLSVISAYEMVFKEQKISEAKIKKGLKALDKEAKEKKMKPFIKKIRRRQLISNLTKQEVEVKNPYGKSNGFRKSRTPLFFFSKKNAVQAIKENYTDCLEGGSWGSPTFVVIEEYKEGFHLAENRWFFEVTFTGDERKFSVKAIKEPLWSKGSINYAIG